MSRPLTSLTVVTVVLFSLVGVTAVPMTVQSASISTVVSTGDPDEVANETTVELPPDNTVNVTVKAENASATDVDIKRNTTTNTVTVRVDANGDGTVDAVGTAQFEGSVKADVDTKTDVPVSLRLVLGFRGE
ncbi:hypothetical protein [Halocatena salina]|uniref:Uncharacterized protein n=1 Tax=Halocatena salina TaxID=2934340 RepID=A0A8U0A1I4_9EURY|nr:hypothetical protein [Halocatena salina]UPM43000.1 hypothetical protein MW046_00770 [Halocatena salina]